MPRWVRRWRRGGTDAILPSAGKNNAEESTYDAVLARLLFFPLDDASEFARQFENCFKCGLEVSGCRNTGKRTVLRLREPSHAVYIPPLVNPVSINSDESTYTNKDPFRNSGTYYHVPHSYRMYQYKST